MADALLADARVILAACAVLATSAAPAAAAPAREGYAPVESGLRIHYRVIGQGKEAVIEHAPLDAEGNQSRIYSVSVIRMSLLEYHLLLALASGPLHGYAIAERVAGESSGVLQPRAGSLYRVIARLVGLGLVAESEAEQEVPHPGLARRYYTLTARGRRTLADETQRLKRTAAVAEKRLGLAARGRS